jgi:hypothetical protein
MESYNTPFYVKHISHLSLLILMPGLAKLSHGASSADDSKQDNHNGNHQESVNQTARSIGSQKSCEPQ